MVRAAALYVLAARRAGDGAHYRRALADADHRVRIEAVRALVSVDDVQGVVDAAGDENREVRIAAAAGLATLAAVAAPASRAVRGLVADTDPLVRAAGLAALGEIGCGQGDYAAVKQALGARPGRCAKARRARWPARPRISRFPSCPKRLATRTWTCARRLSSA
ncbi:HEAT repeats family protein [Mycobacterium intracellulare]|nr:HEAT repeats family protein [Mycobacterium intracellulare]